MLPRTPEDIEQLNSFLRGEIAAVEAYQQCIGRLASDSQLVVELRELEASHQTRVRLLAERIMRLGGQPASGSGAWGVLAASVESGASLVGIRSALRALKRGEHHGSADYRRGLKQLSPDSREFINSEVLPEQQRTQTKLEQLKCE